MKFLVSMFTLFFARESPVSTSANPGCIAKTRIAPSRIQRLFTVNISALTAGAFAAAAAAVAAASAATSWAASGSAASGARAANKTFLFMI